MSRRSTTGRRRAVTPVVVGLVGTLLPLALSSAGNAKPAPITVTQSYSDEDAGEGITCAPGPSHETHWYRRFDLVDEHGAAKGFRVSTVVTRLGEITQVARTLPLQVVVHQIDPGDALQVANLEQLGVVDVSVDEVDSYSVLEVALPVSVALGKDLVLEAWIPDLLAGEDFYLGANKKPELAPDYIRAPFCGSPEPVTVTSIGFPDSNHVLYATGTAVDCTAAATAVAGKRKAVKAAKKKVAGAKADLAEAQAHGTRAEVARAERKLYRAETKHSRALEKQRKARKKAARECAQPELPEVSP